MSDKPTADKTNADAPSAGIEPARRSYRRPSERIFRRSRAAQARREAKDKADFRLIFVLLQFSVLAALVIVAMSIFTQRSLEGNPVDTTALKAWAMPWLGPFSKIDVISFVILSLLAIYFALYFLRRRKG